MKKFTCFFLIFFLSNTIAHAIQKVEISTHDMLPPFLFRSSDGELTGIYLDIVKRATDRMPDYQVTFRVLPWARAKKEIETGKTFAILPPYFHAHDWMTTAKPEQPYIWPYSLPLYTQNDVVMCNDQVLDMVRENFPDDYQGLTFAMTRGDGRAGKVFHQMVTDKKIALLLLDSAKSIVPALITGLADCIVMSKLPFRWYVNQLKEQGLYEKFNKNGINIKEIATISSNEGYLGYTDIDAEINFPFKKDFVIKFDIEIYKMKKRGEIQEIISKYLD